MVPDQEAEPSENKKAVVPEAGWFQCPGCTLVVTGLVRGSGPENQHNISRTHCCKKCELGGGAQGILHDRNWCAGVPGAIFREVSIPSSARPSHYLLHLPEQSQDGSAMIPAPAVLFLHGGMTYIWPEQHHKDTFGFLDANAAARKCVVIAPFATPGEPLSVVEGWTVQGQRRFREKKDRHGNIISYIDQFDEQLVWETFLAACRQLGPRQVDFSRLCVTGLSMGGQATWNIAVRYGSQLAAAAPLAGRCSWKGVAEYANAEKCSEQMKGLPLRSYAVSEDTSAVSEQDFRWAARGNGHFDREEQIRDIGRQRSAKCISFGPDLQLHMLLGMTRTDGRPENHNCWDAVLREDDTFGLFTWFQIVRCAGGGPSPTDTSPSPPFPAVFTQSSAPEEMRPLAQ